MKAQIETSVVLMSGKRFTVCVSDQSLTIRTDNEVVFHAESAVDVSNVVAALKIASSIER
jgi:hypothetical protein